MQLDGLDALARRERLGALAARLGHSRRAAIATARVGRAWAFAALMFGALAVVRHALSSLPYTSTSILEPINALYDVALAGAIVALAWAAGRRMLAVAPFRWHSRLEHAIFSLTVGLALLANLTFALSVVGLLYPATFLVLWVALAIVLREELRATALDAREAAAAVRSLRRQDGSQATFMVVLLVPIMLISISVALLPPAGYDALQYHLEAPRLLIAAHRFVPIPDLAQSAMPFTVEMVYTVCLLFGSEAGPALIHLALAVATGLAVWALADRFFDRRVGWLAVVAFASASEVQRWAPISNADFGPTLYEFLAIYATFVWQQGRERRWLLLGGCLAGVALGMKYTAAPIVGIIALLALASDGFSPSCMARNLAAAAAMVSFAGLIASPWYVKNAVLYHNPVYPLITGAPPPAELALPDVDVASSTASHWTLLTVAAAPLHLLTTGSQYALSGRSWADYAELPFWSYVRGDFEQPARPALLFLALPASLLFVRGRPVLRMVVGASALMTLVWAMGSQELRYLLPAFPCFALLSAIAIVEVTGRFFRESVAKAVIRAIVVASVAAGVVEQMLFVVVVNPFPVLAGAESRAAFLQRVGVHYDDMAYLQRVALPGELTLALGEKRGYYAPDTTILDNSTDNIGIAFVRPGSPEKTAELFERSHIAYVLVAQNDLDWVAQFEPRRLRDGEAAFERFRARYLTEVYRGDHAAIVYRFDPKMGANP